MMAHSEIDAAATLAPGKALRVLVVEDDALVMQTVKLQLEAIGLKVDAAVDGEQALALDLSGYDVMLVDILMPGMGGTSLIRELRNRGLSCRIVAMSGGSTRVPGVAALASAQALGADAVLFKPFGPDLLRNTVMGVEA